jgi:hypothetical protein
MYILGSIWLFSAFLGFLVESAKKRNNANIKVI